MAIQKIGQISGNFSAGEDILSLIRLNTTNSSLSEIDHIGIETKVGNKVDINGKRFEIGKTSHLEFTEEKIYSLSFCQDSKAIIDFSYLN